MSPVSCLISSESSVMRYFAHLAYNGSAFFGWQTQPAHPSVQETLERCLSLLLHSERIPITGCGRTDTGVHASSYYAHFDLDTNLTPSDCKMLIRKMNNFLPKEIVVFSIFPVKPEAHARFDAECRTYKYYINTTKNPFNTNFSYHCFRKLDTDMMNCASKLLVGKHDFTSFSKVHTQVNNFVCDVFEAGWTKNADEVVFTISANRFLRNMVRAIVGTLLEVGTGKLSVDDFRNIIAKRDRCFAKTSAPAHALFLTDVRYPWEKILLAEDE